MLVSLVLTLTTDKPVRLPAHLGRANYSATLERLTLFDTNLGPDIHDAEGVKPLTCSSLFGNIDCRGREAQYRRGERCWVRLTGLNEHVESQTLSAHCGKINRPNGN